MAGCCSTFFGALALALVGSYLYFLNIYLNDVPTPVNTDDIIADGGKFLKLKNGHVLEYFEFGDHESTDTVLFIHGYGQTGRYIKTHSETFKKAKLRVISPTYPGSGLSEFFPYEFTEFPSIMAELMDHVGIESFYCMGISNGGPHVISVSSILGKRVKDVVLVVPLSETTEDNDPFENVPVALKVFMKILMLPTLSEMMNYYATGPSIRKDPHHHFSVMLPEEWTEFLQVCSKEVVDNFAYDHSRGVKRTVESLVHLFRINNLPWHLDYKKVSQGRNVYIYSGIRDTLCPPSGQTYLSKIIPNSQLIRKNSTHTTTMISHLPEMLEKLTQK